jgi:esterase/lipase
MSIHENKANICFLLVPGFAPEFDPISQLQKHFQEMGYSVVATNFWGEGSVDDFSKLTAEQCTENLKKLIAKLKLEYKFVIGIGISLGAAFLIEHAKTHRDLDYIVSIGTPFKLKNLFFINIACSVPGVIRFIWLLLKGTNNQKILLLPSTIMVKEYLVGSFLHGFHKVQTPILFLHSRKDNITDYRAIDRFLDDFRVPKSAVYFDDTNHVFEYDGVVILSEIIKFITNIKPSLKKEAEFKQSVLS